MPLDPEVQVLLRQIAKTNEPPWESLTPKEARTLARGHVKFAGPLDPSVKVEELSIPGPAGSIPVRMYTPDGLTPFPVFVFFHGGGWVIGDLDSTESQCRAIAKEASCKVVSVQYRLAPEHKFPAAPEDAHAATRYLAEHATDLGIDPTRLAVGGDSAGGNLAAVVALMAKDRGTPKISFQLLIYPATDYSFETNSYREFADGYLSTRNGIKWCWNHYLETPEDGNNPYCSVLRAPNLQGLPSAHVITAEFDPLRDEGEAYAARLREAGVQAVTKRYTGMIHGFFAMAGVLDQGKQVLKDCAAELHAVFNQ